MEAGDTKFFVSRGYVHVIGSPRGVGKSEGGGSREWDCYDLIEWIAAQPWCDGNVGMVGISGFGAEQLAVAKKQPPHLRAIFPFDSRGAYGELGGFRDEYPGGVSICSAIWSDISRRCISTKARPARCRRSARRCGARP